MAQPFKGRSFSRKEFSIMRSVWLKRGFTMVWQGITLMTFAASAGAAPLQASVSTIDITPDTQALHVPLGGYGERMNAPAEGVHDSTLAKALILEQGDRKLALVTTDLLGVPRSLREEVLQRLEGSGYSSDNLMMTASHTHASVEMNAMNRYNIFQNPAVGIFDEKLLVFTADRIAELVRQADSSPRVAVKVGTGTIDIDGMNRNRRGDEAVDPQMIVTRIDKADGAPLAILVNYAAHPTFMGPEIMHISAGWPGYLQRELEDWTGGEVTAFYINGAQGDIAPAGVDGPSPFAKAEAYGRKLAVKALEAYKKIEPSAEVPFAFTIHEIELPKRTPPPALLESAGPEYGLTEENIRIVVDAMVPEQSYLGVLRLGGLLAVAIPGELASGLGLEVKQALKDAGAEYPAIFGLGNEWISYMLSPEQYHAGGYEAGVSFYGENLGPYMVALAIKNGKAVLTQ
jgi:hypothetical protein